MTNTTTTLEAGTSTAPSEVYIFELPYGYLRYDSITGPLRDTTQLMEEVPDKSGPYCDSTKNIIYNNNPLESQSETNPNFENHRYYFTIPPNNNKTAYVEDFLVIEYTKKFDHYLLNAQIAYGYREDETTFYKKYNKFVGIVDTNVGPENAKQQCLEMLINGFSFKEERIPSVTECKRFYAAWVFRIDYIPKSFHIKKLGSHSFERLEVKP